MTNDWIAKFGGTSVATHGAMARCAKIIKANPKVRVVVVSAPAGVTNLLVKLTRGGLERPAIKNILNEIRAKISVILESIKPEFKSYTLCQEVMQLLENLEHDANAFNQEHRNEIDAILSFGERFSSRLFTTVLREHGLKADYQDARTLIKTNDNFSKAEVDIQATAKQVTNILLPKYENQIIVTEGFIGSTESGMTTTLGRGGSDYSAAILAEAMHAEILQIWTDVPGIYTVDPGLVPHAKPINNLSFSEAAEMAQFGAKVLHPATLWPAIRKNIPVFVGSSIHPDADGSWIRAKCDDDIPLLRAITLRRHQSLLTINSLEMLHTHGFLAKIFSILSKHKLSVDLVTTSEVSVALTLNQSENADHDLITPEILQELQTIGNVSLTTDKNLCLIALIGNRLHVTPGISGRVFKKISDYNIRLICHGASPHNLCFLVEEKDAKNVVQTIHGEFFG